MNYFEKLLEQIKNSRFVKKNSGFRRSLSMFLACVVIFVTTYWMILPAITLETETADDMAGIYLEDELPDELSGEPSDDLIAEISDEQDNVNEANDDLLIIEEDEPEYTESDNAALGEAGSEDQDLSLSYGFSEDEPVDDIFFDDSVSGTGLTGSDAEDMYEDEGSGSSRLEDGFLIDPSFSDDKQSGSDTSDAVLSDEIRTEEKEKFLAGHTQGTEIRLDFSEETGPDALLTVREIPNTQEEYEEYFKSAEKAAIRTGQDLTNGNRIICGAEFWNLGISNSASLSKETVKVSISFDHPEKLGRDEELLVAERPDGEKEAQWSICEESAVIIEKTSDGSVTKIVFDTKALKNGAADIGIMIISSEETAVFEESDIPDGILVPADAGGDTGTDYLIGFEEEPDTETESETGIPA